MSTSWPNLQSFPSLAYCMLNVMNTTEASDIHKHNICNMYNVDQQVCNQIIHHLIAQLDLSNNIINRQWQPAKRKENVNQWYGKLMINESMRMKIQCNSNSGLIICNNEHSNDLSITIMNSMNIYILETATLT